MFYQPTNLAEALRVRAELGSDVTPLGGGTDLVVLLNRSAAQPKHLLDLSHVADYGAVQRHNEGWAIGGGATFRQLSAMPERALADAARSVGGPAIRNRGTIAGNLGTASPAGDGCTALLAMGARVELTHALRGSRLIPIDDYFVGFRRTALLADELISRVHVPAGWTTAWYKIGKRSAINISIVCCAVALSPSSDVRIAFGAVAPTVLRAEAAERIIRQAGMGDEAVAAAADAAMREVSPIDDHRASANYRRAMCGVILRRLLGLLRDEARPGRESRR